MRRDPSVMPAWGVPVWVAGLGAIASVFSRCSVPVCLIHLLVTDRNQRVCEGVWL